MDPVNHRILDALKNLQDSTGIHGAGGPDTARVLDALIREHQSADDARPLVVLPGQQYLPQHFAVDALQAADSLQVRSLRAAAERCGYYARLGLLSFFLDGGTESDKPDEEAGSEADDPDDGGLSIGHWIDSDLPPLRNASLDATDIVAAFGLNDSAPIGREGGTGRYRYHYGAVMIWSPELNAKLLAREDTETQLAWISYFRTRRERLSDAEHDALRFAMAAGFGDFRTNRTSSMNAVAEWIIAEQDLNFFERLSPGVAHSYLLRIDTQHWIRLIRFFGEERVAGVFSALLAGAGIAALERVIEILCSLLESEDPEGLLRVQLEGLPQYFATVMTGPQDRLGAEGLDALLQLTRGRHQPPPWAYELAHLIARYADREYVHRILVPVVRSAGHDTALGAALAVRCREFLAGIAAQPPEPPADWRREIPEPVRHRAAWAQLRRFLESPSEQVYEYRATQQERKELQAAIGQAADLQLETVRTGSPHRLRITKTHASYEQALRRWEADRLLLARIPV